MKPPADIDSLEEMTQLLTSEYSVDEAEVQSILGRVIIEFEQADTSNLSEEDILDYLLQMTVREVQQRERAREQYQDEDQVDQLRKEKGGILNNEYPNRDPEQWRAKCEANFCRFESMLIDNKVDRVLCPVCGRELWIEPA
ncbi:hypothetical protein [Halapricum desulfuricans]|uniref:Uncharacterized protein n=1 Tax=Halapricum desulfuricans TaxID=2841257 RepID=A0A897NIT7_9EURY|nr:hypothetical protein [Halapricum desulfuricans]QSG14370.1 hypothetical protein HSEST_0826 [Halapricum desulfuricans]